MTKKVNHLTQIPAQLKACLIHKVQPMKRMKMMKKGLKAFKN